MSQFKNEVNNYLVLNEGISFFKNSSKMLRIVNKIESINNIDSEIPNKIKEIAQEMASLEKEFSIANRKDKTKIKIKYNHLTVSYSELLSMINSDEVLGALKKAGALAAVVAATLGGYYYIATNGDIVMKGFSNEMENRFGLKPTDEALNSIKSKIEKDGTVNYIDTLRKEGRKALAGNNSGIKFLDDVRVDTGKALVSAGENMGNLAKVTAAVSGGGVLGLLGLIKAFKMLLGFKKARNIKYYAKAMELINKVEKLS